jgi:hypothetical protein
MARKAGQIIPHGPRTWLVRISIGRDKQSNTRKYQHKTIHGSMRDAQMYCRANCRSVKLASYQIRCMVMKALMPPPLLADAASEHRPSISSFNLRLQRSALSQRADGGACEGPQITNEGDFIPSLAR